MLLLFPPWLPGLLVLAASAFNYVGLTVAQALERAKEVGVRKTVGARRRQIVFQLLSESVLVALGAFVLAYALLTWLAQGFNRLNVMQHEFELQLREATIYDPVLVAVFVAFSVGVGTGTSRSISRVTTMSRDDVPTSTTNVPGSTAQPCAAQKANARSSSSRSTRRLSPAASSSRAKALSSRVGRSTDALGSPT